MRPRLIMRLHLHEEQFDGWLHAMCGVGGSQSPTSTPIRILMVRQFEAANPGDRCKLCDRIWFPNGQPAWHNEAAKKVVNENV